MNQYLTRSGGRAQSEMIMRNNHPQHFGHQVYLVVEGESDRKFFENIVDSNVCKIRAVGSKDDVIAFIRRENARTRKVYLGIVDADFDNVLSKKIGVENVLSVDCHDIEMLILKSNPNIRKIYSELGDNSLISKFEKERGQRFLDAVLNAGYLIGCLKLVAQMDKYKLNMKDLPYIDFIDVNLKVNIDVLISRVKEKKLANEIKADFEAVLAKEYELWQMVCGHDVTNIFAICFSDKQAEGLGYGTNKYLKKERIESLLRVIYDETLFANTEMYSKLIEWQKELNVDIFLKRNTIAA